MMKKYLLLSFAIQFISLAILNAQKPTQTIYDVFEIEKGGCDMDVPVKKNNFVSPPPPDGINKLSGSAPKVILPSSEEIKDFERVKKQIKKSLSKFNKKHRSSKIEYRLALSNNNFFYSENDLIGIKDPKGKIILQPKFIKVIPDTIAKGFVGYTDGRCQYYTADGDVKIKKLYYYIEPLKDGYFKVRSKKGWGLWYNGKEIIAPFCQSIYYKSKQDVWEVKRFEKTNMLYWDNFQDSIEWLGGGYDFVEKDYVNFNNRRFINLKTRQSLICEDGFEIRIVDKDKEYLTIGKIDKKRKENFYLCDFAGNLINENKFGRIGIFLENNLATANVANKPFRIFTPACLIDPQGNRITEKLYNRLEYKSSGKFYITFKKGLRGCLDSKGNETIPPIYDNIIPLKNEQVLAIPSDMDNNAVVLNAVTGELLISNLPYEKADLISICDKEYYKVDIGENERIVDLNFNPVTPEHKSFSLWNDYLLGKNQMVDKTTTATPTVYDCNLFPIKLQFGKYKINEFVSIRNVINIRTANRRFNGMTLYYYIKGGNRSFRELSLYHNYASNQRFQTEEIFGTFIALNKHENIYINLREEIKPIKYSLSWAGEFGIGNLLVTGHILMSPDGKVHSSGFKELSRLDPITGLAYYKYNNLYGGYMNKRGEMLFDGIYQDVHRISPNFFIVKKDNRFGVVDAENREVIPIVATNYNYTNGVVSLFQGKQRSTYDITGKSVEVNLVK